MFEHTETRAVETIYLKCKCGAEFHRECVHTIEDQAIENLRHRTFLAELAADEWMEFHENCYLL